MKKTLVSIIIVAMLLSIMSVCTSAAPEGCTAIDVTDQVKFMTVAEMYKTGTPIIRDDSKFVGANDYDFVTSVGKTPGAGCREIEIKDFDDALYKNQSQFDENYYGGGYFAYNAIWQNNAEDGTTAKSVYNFTVKEAGTYEFVVVGCAQIKLENVGNDAKDRGFSYSVDGGQKYQVNISDSPLIFRDYTYNYTMEEASKAVSEGTYTYYQMGCVYNIKVDLTAGDHTFEYYHIEYSGDTVLNTGNGPRLNYAGFYYQKALNDVELEAYKYPEYVATTTAATTEAPKPTTPAETTKADEPTDTTAEGTTAAGAVTTKATTTAADVQSGGCGSVVSGAVVILAFAGAAFVAAKKKN